MEKSEASYVKISDFSRLMSLHLEDDSHVFKVSRSANDKLAETVARQKFDKNIAVDRKLLAISDWITQENPNEVHVSDLGIADFEILKDVVYQLLTSGYSVVVSGKNFAISCSEYPVSLKIMDSEEKHEKLKIEFSAYLI